MISGLDKLKKELEQLGLAPKMSQWLSYQFSSRWKAEPVVEYQLARIEGVIWKDCLRDICAKFNCFIPTDAEIAEVLQLHKLSTIADLAKALTRLGHNKVSCDSHVLLLEKANCSKDTAAIWEKLKHLAPEDYNDQFALKAYLQSASLDQALERDKEVEQLSALSLKESKSWFPRFFAYDLEEELAKEAYDYNVIGENLRSCRDFEVKAGDILKMQKSGEDSSFPHYVLVSEVADKRVSRAEFKFNLSEPFSADAQGFDLFFLREPSISIAGFYFK
jgi:hypothetical protein